MFPVAWGKARDLTQHGVAQSCVEIAHQHVKATCRVDSSQPSTAYEKFNFTSFAGDYVVETDETNYGAVFPTSFESQHPRCA